jgi:hypothetical protein
MTVQKTRAQTLSTIRQEMVTEQTVEFLQGDDDAFEGAIYICRAPRGACTDAPQGGCRWCFKVAGDDPRTDEEISAALDLMH